MVTLLLPITHRQRIPTRGRKWFTSSTPSTPTIQRWRYLKSPVAWNNVIMSVSYSRLREIIFVLLVRSGFGGISCGNSLLRGLNPVNWKLTVPISVCFMLSFHCIHVVKSLCGLPSNKRCVTSQYSCWSISFFKSWCAIIISLPISLLKFFTLYPVNSP